MMNPGGFDYEARALQEGIRASGYIIPSPDNKLLESHWYHGALNRIRQRLKEKMEENLIQSNTSPWIVALALGERQNISAENWEVLRNTGTNHLMAIAGLHIGLMSSFIFFSDQLVLAKSTPIIIYFTRSTSRRIFCLPHCYFIWRFSRIFYSGGTNMHYVISNVFNAHAETRNHVVASLVYCTIYCITD